MSSKLVTFLSLSLALAATATDGVLLAAGGTRMTPEQMEEQGIENPALSTGAPNAPGLKAAALPAGKVLLIPNSTTDIVAMFDPYDGHYLGDFVNGVGTYATPINAILGPDKNVYLSDQVTDTVYVYDSNGTFLHIYADASDGLDNIRGIAFRGNNLFVSADKYVAEFSAPHTRLADYINDGNSYFDVTFLPDGSSLVANITTDYICHHSPTGAFLGNVVFADFAEQVQLDPILPGDYIETAFSEKSIKDFDLAGTISQTTTLPTYGRGVYRLGNGNLLSASSAGLQELVPGTGAVVNTIDTSTYWRHIEEVNLSSWTDLGFDLPGALGSPLLVGDGALKGGTTVTLALTNAAPNTFAHLIIGATKVSLPFYGGTLVPAANVIVALPTGAAGALSLPAIYPMGLPPGFPIYLQYWIQDATGPLGLTASNAITATTE